MKKENKGFADAIVAVASIINVFKSSNEIRKLRVARRSLKKFKRQLSKNGWEEWEEDIFDDLVKSYSRQLKRIMVKN